MTAPADHSIEVPFQRHTASLWVLYLVSAVFFLGLAVYDWQRIGEGIEEIAKERGRVLFKLIELTREWNAHHGGIYAPVSEQVQPNPYLEHPLRDQKTVEGRQLTMINPAFMTRQIAELAEQSVGVRFRITSLKPIRPANAADSWEAAALQAFENDGLEETIEFFPGYAFGNLDLPAHRYMAPLVMKPPCMACHEKQGYAVGDIRGGISVTMPSVDLLAVRDQRRRASLLLILGGFVITTALLHLLAVRAQRHYRDLRRVAERQERVIVERTRELEERNHALNQEIEERRRRANELRIAGAVFEGAAEGIIVTDGDNNILRVNPAFTAITGFTPVEVTGCNPRLLKSGRHDKAFYGEMWSALEKRGHWEGEIWNRHKSGHVFVEWLSITRIDDEGSGAGKYLAVFHDITRRKEAEELLRHKAHHDALTDLPNRALFYDRLQAAFSQARRYRRTFALLLVDLDRFKEVNDSLGHAAGDEVLMETARRLSSCVRESDTVARLGGTSSLSSFPKRAAKARPSRWHNAPSNCCANRSILMQARPAFPAASASRIIRTTARTPNCCSVMPTARSMPRRPEGAMRFVSIARSIFRKRLRAICSDGRLPVLLPRLESASVF